MIEAGMIQAGMLEGWQQLHLLRPHWLWALAVLPLLAWMARRRRRQGSAWRGAVDPHLLPHLIDAQPGRRERGAAWMVLLAAMLAILALAGPSWQREPRPLWQARAPLVLALDLSGAIQAGDLPPTRLAQARARLDTLLRERGDGQAGLLVYAQDAYVVAPLTDDAANVALFLDALHPSIMPGDTVAPSSAAPAIERSVRLLRRAGFDSGDILLLSDHADAGANAAAASAAADGFRVSALGLGSTTGAPWRDATGSMQYARLDAGSLRALAAAGKGRYATVAADGSDLAALGILDIEPTHAVASNDKAASIWRDQGYWLLLPLLLLVPLGFRRNGVFALLALCLVLPAQPAFAAGGSAADGDWWRRADQQAHQRLREGADAYNARDYAAASAAWQDLPGADAKYNLGNALAREGKYEQAVAAYDEALRQQPGMEDAAANRKAVLAAMKRKPPQGGGKGDKGEDDKRDDGGKGGAGDAGKSKDASTRGGTPQQQPADGQPRQQDGDASAQDSRARAPETAAQREKRLANQAWLRRVPDDPGGLLRERFRLEQYRRQQEGE
ncbi:MAG: VWA domain-containing protein [Pseudomonadota bacterium]|nr:VWA domain-containing protein [Pseudomonadota bacterium]